MQNSRSVEKMVTLLKNSIFISNIQWGNYLNMNNSEQSLVYLLQQQLLWFRQLGDNKEYPPFKIKPFKSANSAE